MHLNDPWTQQLSRRGLLLAAAAGTIGTFLPKWTPLQIASPDPEVASAAFMYCNLGTGEVIRRGVAVTRSQYVVGAGQIGPRLPNKLQSVLPFTGADIRSNTLPQGLDWHGSTAPKTLLAADGGGIRWRGRNTTSRYSGGVRTRLEVAAPGESILVSFKARMTDVVGHREAALMISLLRTTDSTSTTLERVYTARDQSFERCVVRLTAPPGGTSGWKLVFTGEAGDGAPDQQATFEIRDLMVTSGGASSPWLGERYAAPPYAPTEYVGGDIVVDPKLAASEFYLVARTIDFGWIGVPVEVNAQSPKISFSEVFGPDACLTVAEFYLVARSRWQAGWISKLAGASTWLPLRYTNIDGIAGKSRPESQARLSRASGMVAGHSIPAGTTARSMTPSLDAPPETWAASFDSSRWSYVSFRVDKAPFIGETTVPAGVRSELHVPNCLDYDRPYWFSFAFRVNTTVHDGVYSRKVVLFQTRYTKNASADSSALGPELALEQLPGDRFAVSYRTDDGVPVLAGSGTPAGITTRTLGPWYAPRGRWQNLVIRANYSRSGGGELGVWLNGETLINAPVPLGYNRANGPKVRFGAYKFSDYPATTEFQNFEFGPKELSGRILRPLAV